MTRVRRFGRWSVQWTALDGMFGRQLWLTADEMMAVSTRPRLHIRSMRRPYSSVQAVIPTVENQVLSMIQSGSHQFLWSLRDELRDPPIGLDSANLSGAHGHISRISLILS